MAAKAARYSQGTQFSPFTVKIIFRQDVIGWNGVGGGAWQMHAFPVPR